jgi:hypothetical protein
MDHLNEAKRLARAGVGGAESLNDWEVSYATLLALIAVADALTPGVADPDPDEQAWWGAGD